MYPTRLSAGHHLRSSAIQLGTVDSGATTSTGLSPNNPIALAPATNTAVCTVFPRPISSPRMALAPSRSLFRSQRTPSRWYACSTNASADVVVAAGAAPVDPSLNSFADITGAPATAASAGTTSRSK